MITWGSPDRKTLKCWFILSHIYTVRHVLSYNVRIIPQTTFIGLSARSMHARRGGQKRMRATFNALRTYYGMYTCRGVRKSLLFMQAREYGRRRPVLTI